MGKRINNGWRNKLYTIIYEADTPLGKLFDVVLLILIVVSVIFVMVESVKGLRPIYTIVYFMESG